MDLQSDLKKIGQVLDLPKTLQQGVSPAEVTRYYQLTNYFYRRFHSREGAMHLPLYLPQRAQNHYEGLYEQANLIQDFIQNTDNQQVMEIGCGQGFNSIYLAKQNPQHQFVGLDLTALHIRQAQQKAQGLPNLTFRQGDFQKMDFAPHRFDLVFAIESFCYTRDISLIFKQLASVLKPQGKVIIFDVFTHPGFENLTADLQLAIHLNGIGFAVEKWWNIEELRQNAQIAGLEVLIAQNLASAIMPNLLSFQKGARRMFRYPQLTKLLLQLGVLPSALVKHAMSGVLAPYSIGEVAQGYFQIVLQKNK
ncbi:MAG: methyltransferase domain-containing protein [Microscillaceae bacterium]|nr:methyltransferase domain-containing protein [Microscillaceae bacterium]